ncbi:MAG: Crp/Fnr family transcriptional regulator [Sphingopyxis sp.]|nr:Crp/Fnr family transcriptional regulator [Sphingopyxis sp.]
MAAAGDLEAAAAALHLCGWLDGHGADLRGQLLAEGRLRRFTRGQWVSAEGDEEGGLFVVVRGTFQTYAEAVGDREVLLSQVTRGRAFGQSVRFGGGPRLVTAISLGDGLILQADDHALARIAEREPLIWRAIASLHYAQLRAMVQLIAEFTALPPRQRLAARLLRFATGQKDSHRLLLAQQDLADMTGLSRKTVNACLSELEARGLIRRKYASIDIVDLPGLRAYASAPARVD